MDYVLKDMVMLLCIKDL